MGWFTKTGNETTNETEAQRSHKLGAWQRNADNGAGGEGRGTRFGDGKGPARDQAAYVRGYVDHGNDHIPWF